MSTTAIGKRERRRPQADTGRDPLEGQFETIKQIVYDTAGIALNEAKRELVRSRLARRLRVLGDPSVRDYIAFVQTPDGRFELTEMVDVLTTNKTAFFREDAHFTFLAEALERRMGRGVTIWSAGCSSGEEPYTLAMVLAEYHRRHGTHGSRILATDISDRVLTRARAAEYDREQLSPVPFELADRYLQPGSAPGRLTIAPELRRMVRFARLNLMGPWPMKGPFEVIFCRNVMIYFDTPTRQTLVQRFTDLLAPGGYLMTGHSESITSLSHDLTYVQPALYQKAGS